MRILTVASRNPDRPDKIHSQKEKAVRSDPRMVALANREKKIPHLFLCLWNSGADQVPFPAGLGKKPRVKLVRASIRAGAGEQG